MTDQGLNYAKSSFTFSPHPKKKNSTSDYGVQFEKMRGVDGPTADGKITVEEVKLLIKLVTHIFSGN